MNDEEDSDVSKSIQRKARIQARAFSRLFKTPDGKLVLATLKEEFGWEAISPPTGKDGEISTKKMREWIGCRSVLGNILHKISMGDQLNGNPKYQDDDEN